MRSVGEVDRTWSVGELARATGLTIRALHHYDEIGLLVPARSEAGHRVYSPADVERLYRVLALRGLGLALDEIAAALDDGSSLIDTIRRHVAALERDIEQRRRVLGRLRGMLDALERSSAPTVEELIGAVEAMTVVEATVEDVVTRDPWVEGFELTAPFVVLLKETGGERILPIWIGEPEAGALMIRRTGATLSRPLGPDLTVALLGAVDARIQRVVIERLRDHTFLATVTVVSGGDAHEVDARPSDALNLALRFGATIQIASEVIDTAGRIAWPDPRDAGAGAEPAWTPLSEQRGGSRTAKYSVGEHSPTVLRIAASEAQQLGDGRVCLRHLLLAVLADEDDPAARLLERHGVTLSHARKAVAAVPGDAQDAPAREQAMFLTLGAVFAMHRARVQAQRLGATGVPPMHVLWSLVDSPEAGKIPGFGGVNLAALCAEVSDQLDA